MNNNYQEKYQVILNHLKEILNDNYLDQETKEIYLKYIKMVEEHINENSTQKDYIEAIKSLLIVLEETKELNHSNEANYTKVRIPKEKEAPKINEQKKQLKAKIDVLKKQQAIIKKQANKYKTNIISYILALAIVIGAPVGMYLKAKNTPKEKLYKTYKEIHTTEDVDHDFLRPGYIYINLYDIPTYSSNYEELLPHPETIEIKEYNPWITEGTESKRLVVTIEKDASTMADTIYENELPSLVREPGSYQEYEYRYNVEIPYSEKYYTENIYKITRLVQDTNDYIEKDLPFSVYTDLIIVLLIELLLLFGEIEITENTMLGRLIEEIIRLSNNKMVSNKQKEELEELIEEYINLNKEHSKIKKRNI